MVAEGEDDWWVVGGGGGGGGCKSAKLDVSEATPFR